MIYKLNDQYYEACIGIEDMARNDPDKLLDSIQYTEHTDPYEEERVRKREEIIEAILSCVAYQRWGLHDTAEMLGKKMKML